VVLVVRRAAYANGLPSIAASSGVGVALEKGVGQDTRCEVTLILSDTQQLLVPPTLERLHEVESLFSGIEQLLNELNHQSLKNGVKTMIVLPRTKIVPGVEDEMRATITRYSELRARGNENDLKAVTREGIHSLWVGAIVLAVGLALSQLTLRSTLPEGIRLFFGEGVFLVAAWVGIWYPLDTLLSARRPYLRERSILGALREMEIVVEAAD